MKRTKQAKRNKKINKTRKSKKSSLRIKRKSLGGGPEKSIIYKKLLPELGDVVDSYLGPVALLHLKNRLWKVENSHGNGDTDIFYSTDSLKKITEDNEFISSYKAYMDTFIKTFIWERKMHNLNPKNVYSEPTFLSLTYGDILLVTLWRIGDYTMEIVDIYDPITKKFSQYRGSEYIMTPVTYLNLSPPDLMRTK